MTGNIATPDLNLTTTLPALGFNFEGLKAWVTGITEQYTGLVVQENDVPAIKSEMVGLNKIKAQLDAACKETVKQVSAPIKEFEGQIKELTGLLDTTYRFLADQVDGYEARARDGRRHGVQVQIDALKDKHGVQALAIPIQESWLSKTAKPKVIAAEIESIILAHLQAEKEKAALEQAKRDRAVYIEEKCAALGKVYGFVLPASQFLHLHDLSFSMQDVGTSIDDAYQFKAHENADKVLKAAEGARKAEERAKAAQTAPLLNLSEPLPVQPEVVQVVSPAYRPAPMRRPAASTIKRVLAFSYYAHNEPEVARLLRELEGLCVEFEVADYVDDPRTCCVVEE